MSTTAKNILKAIAYIISLVLASAGGAYIAV